MSTRTTTSEPAESDYPATWYWDEDGDVFEGTFLRAGVGYTAQGSRPFVVCDVGDTERTLWLLGEVLRNIFAREVHRRPDKRIHAGERIAIRRLGKRESVNGREYANFRADFPDGPELEQADVFGPPPETDYSPQADAVASEPNHDDDIPFG